MHLSHLFILALPHLSYATRVSTERTGGLGSSALNGTSRAHARDVSLVTRDQNDQCLQTAKDCPAAVIFFRQKNYKFENKNDYKFWGNDPDEILHKKDDAYCIKHDDVDGVFKDSPAESIRLHKQNAWDQTWGCAFYKSDDCSTDFFWTFGSVPQITFSNPDFSGKIKSFKCWKAGAYQGYD